MFLLPFILANALIQTTNADDVNLALSNQRMYRETLPMLIYFTADRCSACAEFDALFEQPELLRKMEQYFVTVRVSIDEKVGKACADIYGIRTIPAVVVADYKGVILYKSDETLSVHDVQLLIANIPEQDITSGTLLIPTDIPLNTTLVSTPLKNEPTATDTNTQMISKPSEESSLVPSVVQVRGDENNIRIQSQTSDAAIIENQHSIAGKTEAEKSSGQNLDNSDVAVTKKIIVGSSRTSSDQRLVKTAEIQGTPPETSNPTSRSTPTGASRPGQTRTIRTYAIQLGYFSLAPNAQKLMHKAQSNGLSEVRTETETHDGKFYYRVLVGKYLTLAEAQSLLARVTTLGLKGAVYRK
ncbi:MAG TPA: SPOR domain-containing protein [Saprospiraceae bacterium]|nr:SPOR domain-containing protein [Saprospiraceae bacterium]